MGLVLLEKIAKKQNQYEEWGKAHLEFLRKEHGKHKLDNGLKLVGNSTNEKGIIGNGDFLFKGTDGKEYIATMHAGKDYIKPYDGKIYL